MRVRRLFLPLALFAAVATGMTLGTTANAQELNPVVDPPPAPAVDERVSIFPAQAAAHPSETDEARYRRTAREMRTARAIFRANQRVARLERNLWLGYEPLRPRWNAVPMMSSRYNNPKFYVPVYVYNR